MVDTNSILEPSSLDVQNSQNRDRFVAVIKKSPKLSVKYKDFIPQLTQLDEPCDLLPLIVKNLDFEDLEPFIPNLLRCANVTCATSLIEAFNKMEVERFLKYKNELLDYAERFENIDSDVKISLMLYLCRIVDDKSVYSKDFSSYQDALANRLPNSYFSVAFGTFDEAFLKPLIAVVLTKCPQVLYYFKQDEFNSLEPFRDEFWPQLVKESLNQPLALVVMWRWSYYRHSDGGMLRMSVKKTLDAFRRAIPNKDMELDKSIAEYYPVLFSEIYKFLELKGANVFKDRRSSIQFVDRCLRLLEIGYRHLLNPICSILVKMHQLGFVLPSLDEIISRIGVDIQEETDCSNYISLIENLATPDELKTSDVISSTLAALSKRTVTA